MEDRLRCAWHASRVKRRKTFGGSTSTTEIVVLRMTEATLIHGVHAIDANHWDRHATSSLKCDI